jgi:hypothetical protein
MPKNLNQMSLTELRAEAYIAIQTIEQAQAYLRTVNGFISEKQNKAASAPGHQPLPESAKKKAPRKK